MRTCWSSIAARIEATYYEQLKLRQRGGEVHFWLRQVPVHLPGGTKYVLDFVVFLKSGEVQFVDVKGRETKEFRIKKREVEHHYPRVAALVSDARPRPLDLSAAADRWRMRLVIYDATDELVWPEHRLPRAVLAKAAKMRRASYCEAHRCATSVLQAALNDGRREFQALGLSRPASFGPKSWPTEHQDCSKAQVGSCIFL